MNSIDAIWDEEDAGRRASDDKPVGEGAPSVYHRVALAAVRPEDWAYVLSTACDDAEAGDDHARDFLRRILGVADAARIEFVFDALLGAVSHSQLLRDVADYRARLAGVPTNREPSPPELADPPTPSFETYWSVAFRVVTPERWRRIIQVALAQAIDGNPRARTWVAHVLGANDSAMPPELSESDSKVVRFGRLYGNSVAEDERRAAED